MSGTVIVIINQEPAHVLGSHGGSAVVQWKRLAVAGFSSGVLDSFDHNRVPPGAAIGLHTHHVTEEIYVVLSGSAEMFAGADRVPIGPGDVALMGRGGSHGAINGTGEDLVFLVVEALPPSTLRALYGGDASTPDPDRSQLVVRHVEDGGSIDLADLLNAAWGPLEMTRLSAGDTWTAETSDFERCVYLIDGSGRLSYADGDRDLAADTALVFAHGSEGTITAGHDGLRLVSVATGFDALRTAALSAEPEAVPA